MKKGDYVKVLNPRIDVKGMHEGQIARVVATRSEDGECLLKVRGKNHLISMRQIDVSKPIDIRDLPETTVLP